MTDFLETQIFRYPVYRDANYLISANEGVLLGALCTIVLLWSCFYAPTVHPNQTWIQRGLVVVCFCFTVLLWYLDKIMNGYIEVTETNIKHVYKSDFFISLDWDDIAIVPQKLNGWLSSGVQLVSKSGKRTITIHGNIREYETLFQIIEKHVRCASMTELLG